MTALDVHRLGRRAYVTTLEEMRALVDARARDEISDRLLLVEHEGVYTSGRRTDESDWVAPGTDVVAVERGGRVTWHGPGQLVAYPIVALSGKGRDLHAWLRLHEDVVIDALSKFGIEGTRDPDGTGVFVERRKIASIGIAVRRWVSFHGLALNVDPDLGVFAKIRPCGFEASRMTSIVREIDAPPALGEVMAAIEAAFQTRLAAYPRD